MRDTSVTQSGATGRSLAASLGAAREELRADIARGAGGRDGARALFGSRRRAAAAAVHRGAGADGAGGGARARRLRPAPSLPPLRHRSAGPVRRPHRRRRGAFLRAFLHPLWDLGVVVGPPGARAARVRAARDRQPRVPAGAARRAADRRRAARCSTASRPSFHTASTHAFILRSLLELIDERHAGFNDTLYQLEPDVKEAPGALRDLSATRTIALLTDPLLLRKGPAEPARFDDAEDFLLRVRSILHLEAGRNQNVLSHELQERTAELLGYPGADAAPARRAADERLLPPRAHRQPVARAGRGGRRRCRSGPTSGCRATASASSIRFRRRAIRPRGWARSRRRVEHRHRRCPRKRCRASSSTSIATAPTTSSRRRAIAPRCWRSSSRGAGSTTASSEMHDCGLLGRVFPEFQAISWRVVRDFYHKYTVDEHTLLTIRNLERLDRPTSSPAASASRTCWPACRRRSCWCWRCCCTTSASGATTITRSRASGWPRARSTRLQITGDARETVLFLIRHHLRMSLVAFRRDTEDPDVVKEFADFIGTEERLKMLCLMTLADVEAVSPDTLTPWKEELLWRLYVDTYNHLTQRYGDELHRAQPGRARPSCSRPARATSPTAGDRRASSRGCRSATCSCSRREAIYQHVRLARDIRPDEVHLSLERERRPVWTLAVATLDRPFLFSNICGVLSSFGMNILRGHALTNPNGLVLDVFQFTDDERFLELNADAPAPDAPRCCRTSSPGRADVAGAAARPRAGRAAVQASIRVRAGRPRRQRGVGPLHDPRHRGAATRSACCYRISRVISQHGCDVDLGADRHRGRARRSTSFTSRKAEPN